MGRVRAEVTVAALASAAEELWYDTARWPTFVDNRHFVYTAQGVGDGTGIFLASLDSPASTRLIGAYSNSAFVDGRLLFVSEDALVAHARGCTSR